MKKDKKNYCDLCKQNTEDEDDRVLVFCPSRPMGMQVDRFHLSCVLKDIEGFREVAQKAR